MDGHQEHDSAQVEEICFGDWLFEIGDDFCQAYTDTIQA